MAVDCDQVTKGLYFWLDGRRERIWEMHLSRITEVSRMLEPIKISDTELLALGFKCVRNNEFTKYSIQAIVSLERFVFDRKPTDNWHVRLNNNDNQIYLKYVHEVQLLWFSLCRVHLSYPQSASLPDQPDFIERQYYSLSSNFRFLARHPEHAVWEIGYNYYPQVEIMGQMLGLKLVAGKGVAGSDTSAALVWLVEFIKNKVQIGLPPSVTKLRSV